MPRGDAWLTHAGQNAPDSIRLEPAYHPHWAAYRASPGPHTAAPLLAAARPVLDAGVRAFGGADAGPAVRARAKVIAAGALKTYDPARGTLKNHLLTHLQGLQRYAARQGQVIAVPERVAMESRRLDDAERELRDLNDGRSPSTSELADHTGIPIRRIAQVRRYRPGFLEGQAAALSRDESGEAGDPAVERDDPAAARAELLYHGLSAPDQLLLEHLAGLHGRERLPVGLLARKLGVTPGAVSQRAAKIQAQLDELADAGVL